MLSIHGLNFSYGARQVLRDISFQVQPGTLCALFGANGSGKTTLFKCCLKFLKPHAGEIWMEGKNLSRLGVRTLSRIAAYVPQEHKTPFSYTVRDIVLMGRSPHMNGVFGSAEKDRTIVLEVLAKMGISHLADKPYNQLSGGQRQLTLISRALAQDTPLLFLDEPTSSLDFKNQIMIWELLREIARQGRTVVVCTHDPNHVLWFCDHVIVLEGQKGIIAQGAPAQALDQGALNALFGDICTIGNTRGKQVVLPGE